MKKKSVQYLILIMTIAVGCSSDKQSSDDLPFLDVTKNYPEKEFILTDVADVTFTHLSTENSDFLFSNPFGESIYQFTKNTIVVYDIF